MHKFINNSSTISIEILQKLIRIFVFPVLSVPLGLPEVVISRKVHVSAGNSIVLECKSATSGGSEGHGHRSVRWLQNGNRIINQQLLHRGECKKKDTGAFYSIHSRMPSTIPTLRRYTWWQWQHVQETSLFVLCTVSHFEHSYRHLFLRIPSHLYTILSIKAIANSPLSQFITPNKCMCGSVIRKASCKSI